MAKRLTSIRFSDLTDRQLPELAQRLAMSQSEVVTVAIDRLYQSEIANDSRSVEAGARGTMFSPDVWPKFWERIGADPKEDVEGLIWQAPNGQWFMLAADPTEVGRVVEIQVEYNPFTGQKLE